jgi:hypothetical protein
VDLDLVLRFEAELYLPSTSKAEFAGSFDSVLKYDAAFASDVDEYLDCRMKLDIDFETDCE